MPADIDAKVRASFAQQSMMASLGAEIVTLEPGRVALSAPVQDGFKQQQGFAHAGVTFALGDSAAGYAALSVMPLEVEVMTAEIKINLLAPATGRLIAEGRVLKAGRRLVVVAADVFAELDGTRTHIAALQGTMVPVNL
nr:PaaI family thioesterase [Litoreibacter ponti]